MSEDGRLSRTYGGRGRRTIGGWEGRLQPAREGADRGWSHDIVVKQIRTPDRIQDDLGHRNIRRGIAGLRNRESLGLASCRRSRLPNESLCRFDRLNSVLVKPDMLHVLQSGVLVTEIFLASCLIQPASHVQMFDCHEANFFDSSHPIAMLATKASIANPFLA